ncbi:hypothetical protein PCASD_26757, partial [Puccinia coronata f. sp. avenae]
WSWPTWPYSSEAISSPRDGSKKAQCTRLRKDIPPSVKVIHLDPYIIPKPKLAAPALITYLCCDLTGDIIPPIGNLKSNHSTLFVHLCLHTDKPNGRSQFQGNEVNPTVWTAIQDNRHVEEPKKPKAKAKKTKKAATQSATEPTSQEPTAANNAMDFNQRKRSSATPIPMTPQPAVLPVEALGAAANALPSIPLPATKRDNSPEMGLEEARKELMLPKKTGPQRPGGNNPVPLIDSLEDQAQIALIMLNTHYGSYVGANNRRQLAIAEMHLRKCISAQETLRSWVGNSMTITLSQGWSAKYQLFKLKEWMQQNMPRTPNHQDQSLTTGTRNQGHLQLPQQGIPENGNQFTQENSPPNFSHQSTNANTAHYPAANHTPG